MMARRMVIGLTGQPGTGKDSCAEALEPHRFLPIAFADALRHEVVLAWRVDLRILTDRITKETALPALSIGMCGEPDFINWATSKGLSLAEPRSPRWVLQRWGTEFRREQNADYWVQIVERWIRRQMGVGYDRIVITDVRMPNEAELVRRLGGKLLRVHRPDVAPMAPETADHSSEAHAALAVDGVIHNDSSLDALHAEVQRVLAGLFPADLAEPIV
jgi:hypothetical protein